MELSTYLPVSCLVVLFLVTAQEIRCGTYIANHVMGYNAPESHQIDGVPHPVGGFSLSTEYPGEKKTGLPDI